MDRGRLHPDQRGLLGAQCVEVAAVPQKNLCTPHSKLCVGHLLQRVQASSQHTASSVVSGSRQPGVNGPRRTGTQWLQSVLHDLLKAFDTWRTRSRAAWDHPRVCLRNNAPPVSAGRGTAGGAFGAPTVSIRVVVDDLLLQRLGDHNWVAHELELASTCVASKLTQAGCEVATKKSKVLSHSVSVRAKL